MAEAPYEQVASVRLKGTKIIVTMVDGRILKHFFMDTEYREVLLSQLPALLGNRFSPS